MATKANELLAAAEYFATHDGCTCDPESGVTNCMGCDIAMMARHILATVPADDAEPVTVEFIAKNWHPTPLEGSPQWWWINDRVFLCCDDMGFWTACTPDSDPETWHPFASLMTVGDVRQLCDLLGLKGGA